MSFVDYFNAIFRITSSHDTSLLVLKDEAKHGYTIKSVIYWTLLSICVRPFHIAINDTTKQSRYRNITEPQKKKQKQNEDGTHESGKCGGKVCSTTQLKTQ